MSHFSAPTYHPETGEVQMANWMDDYFGKHRYGVRFPDGQVFNPETTDIKRPDMEIKEEHEER